VARRVGRPVSLLTILAIGALLGGCDGGPSTPPSSDPRPPTGAGPTARPSFVAPGSPSGLSPEQIRAEIEPLMGQAGISLGEGANGVIQVGLRANAEAVARELVETYGSAIQVTVGLFPYPPPAAPQRACQRLAQVVAVHPPLSAAVLLPPTVVGGDFLKGQLRITNTSGVPYELITSSTFSVFLFRPGEALPIGGSEGGVMGTGYGKTLGPGEAVGLDAGGGTASCDLAVGYVVPAGTYQARALVDVQDPVTFENRFFWSDPTSIEVVDP
jgi:hypothetical protein